MLCFQWIISLHPMKFRYKDDGGRRTVLAREQTDDQNYGMSARGPRRRRGGRLRRLVPALLISAFALLIAYEEIPAFANWWEKAFFPRNWQTKNTCQQAALKQSNNPDYARILKPGKVHKTENGAYVDRLVLGEMGQDGTEQKVEYTCYLDSAGALVKLNRLGSKKPVANDREIRLSPTSSMQ